MRLIGFDANENSAALAEKFATDDITIGDRRELNITKGAILYTLPGLPLCWKCTMKHIGQAVGFAAELDAYPERIACVVGELGHAYRECPSASLAEKIRNTYTKILDTGCVPDFTELLKEVNEGWFKNVVVPSNDQ